MLIFAVLTVFLAPLTSVFTANATAASAGVQSFHFDSFEADYYVTKNPDGTAHLKVHETLTAVFPNYNQNHGITRSIPYTNNAGKNITIASESALNLQVTRNGVKEPVNKIEKENGAYTVYVGSASEYVHGTQVYDLTYEFDNVILDYDASGESTYDPAAAVTEELYWDTNGTGWSQPFGVLTARVHFEADALQGLTGETSCYVGKHYSNNSSRCTTTKLSDGYAFTASNLSAYENLTFDISLTPGTFVSKITYNYTLVIISVILALLAAFIFYRAAKSHAKYKEKRDFYKTCPTPPQYTPPKDLSLPDAQQIAIGNTKPAEVAVLIDLAIRGKIELIKGKKKIFSGYHWSIHAKDTTGLSRQEEIVLQILNGGELPAADETFEIKTYSYNSTLESLGKSFKDHTKNSLSDKGLKETDTSLLGGAGSVVAVIIGFFAFNFTLPFLMVGLEVISESGGILVGAGYLIPLDILLIIAMIAIPVIVSSTNAKYKTRTMKGLETAVYLNGLRLYMDMAEKERLEFLQSVKGADTSNSGIVKLYERLLPYAIIFGIENSWLEELNRYYELAEVGQPAWYVGHGPIIVSDFRGLTTSVNSSYHSGTTAPSSSSGHSGGGGGGFSGGGGGGGGGGGW